MSRSSFAESTDVDSVHWLTIKEASELLRVNVSTLRRWADRGAIKALRTPGGHRTAVFHPGAGV
ncbi:MAG: helix-turn-helix domain-containing protein [Deltaproteobacteria bacterium]|nr:helix-turn-helix domain-containing protein [Deltaproteobacteria bacterium]